MNEVELAKRGATLREELRVVKFKTEGAKSKNVKESQILRRQIARVLTQINKNNINTKQKIK